MTLPGGGDVGTAYIRILADGSDLDQSIRDEFGRHDKIFDDQGNKDGEAYSKAYGERLRRGYKKDFKDLDDNFKRQRAKYNLEGDFLGGTLGRHIRASLSKSLGEINNTDISDRIFARLQKQFNEGVIDLDGVKRQLNDFVRLRTIAIKEIEKDESSARARSLNNFFADQREQLATIHRSRDERLKIEKDFSKQFEKLLDQRVLRLKDNNLRESQAVRDGLRSRIDAALTEIRHGDTALATELRRTLTEFNHAAEQKLVKTTGFFRSGVRELDKMELSARRVDKQFDKIADSAGRAFGKGSRNNFFNALGSSVEGLLKVTLGGVPKIISVLGELGGEFGNAAREGDGFFGKLGGIGDVAAQNFVQAGDALIKTVIGIGGAFGLFIGVAAPLVVLVSALAGGIVALAGAIGFGLAGAIGAALPLILPLIAGLGTVAIVFAGLRKESKAFRAQISADLKPITTEFKALQKATIVTLFSRMKETASALAPVLRTQLVPLFSKLGGAIADVVLGFSKALAGPAFTKFFQAMQVFLPAAVRSLGKTFTSLLVGFAGLFRALLPFANRLLAIMEKGADRFAKWANSAKGQNRIADFMDRAWSSAGKLWRVIEDLFKVTGDLLSAGRGPGGGFLDSISATLERFSTFLRSPAGQVGLGKFFQQAKDVFVGLGKLADGIGKLFGALNSPAGQKILDSLLRGLGALFTTIGKLIPPFVDMATNVLPGIITGFKDMFFWVKPLFTFLSEHEGVAKTIGIGLAVIYTSLKLIKTVQIAQAFFAPFLAEGGFLGGLAGRVGLMSSNLRLLSGAMAGVTAGAVIGSQAGGGSKGWLVSIFGGAAAGAALGSIGGGIGALTGALTGGLTGAVSHLKTEWDDQKKHADDALKAAAESTLGVQTRVDALSVSLQAAGGHMNDLTKAFIAQGLQKSGIFDQVKNLQVMTTEANSLGLSLGLVTDAASGNQASLTKLNSILDTLWATNSDPKIQQSILDLKGAIGEQAAEVVLAAQKNIDYAESLKQFAFASVSAKDEAKQWGTALEGNSAAVLMNQQFIRDHTDKLLADAQAQIDHGKSFAGTNTQLGIQVQKFRDQLIAAGFSKQKIDELLTDMGKLHPVAPTVKVPGAVDSRSKMDTLIDRMRTYGKLHPVATAGVNTADATAKIEALANLINTTINSLNKLQALGGGLPGSELAKAAGGILNGPTRILAGEAGREAIVPLNRPLSLVDPSVRWLSAIAQGKDPGAAPRFANGGVVGGGKTVTFEPGAVTIVTPTEDPKAVATEFFNLLVAEGYS